MEERENIVQMQHHLSNHVSSINYTQADIETDIEMTKLISIAQDVKPKTTQEWNQELNKLNSNWKIIESLQDILAVENEKKIVILFRNEKNENFNEILKTLKEIPNQEKEISMVGYLNGGGLAETIGIAQKWKYWSINGRNEYHNFIPQLSEMKNIFNSNLENYQKKNLIEIKLNDLKETIGNYGNYINFKKEIQEGYLINGLIYYKDVNARKIEIPPLNGIGISNIVKSMSQLTINSQSNINGQLNILNDELKFVNNLNFSNKNEFLDSLQNIKYLKSKFRDEIIENQTVPKNSNLLNEMLKKLIPILIKLGNEYKTINSENQIESKKLIKILCEILSDLASLIKTSLEYYTKIRSGAIIGATVGTLIPIVGTSVGAVTGSLCGLLNAIICDVYNPKDIMVGEFLNVISEMIERELKCYDKNQVEGLRIMIGDLKKVCEHSNIFQTSKNVLKNTKELTNEIQNLNFN